MVGYQSWGPGDHQGIFVETHETGLMSGHLYQVTGSMQQGMDFEHKKAYRPEDSATYANKTLLGNVKIDDYPRVLEICQAIEPPKKQFQLNKRLYPGVPLRTCQEWTQEAIDALKTAQIIKAEEQAQA